MITITIRIRIKRFESATRDDTHFGADGRGYCQQPAYPSRLPALLDALGNHDLSIDFRAREAQRISRAASAVLDAALSLLDA